MADRRKAARKAAQTRLELKYAKEQVRLLDFQKALEAEGYRFTGSALPKAPKKITAGSVRKLQNITPEYILKQATFLDDETGRITGGLVHYGKAPAVEFKPPAPKQYGKRKKTAKGAYISKKRKPKKQAVPRREDIVIDNFKGLLSEISAENIGVYRKLSARLDKEIKDFGKAGVARTLEQYPLERVQKAVGAINHYGADDPRGVAAYNDLYEMITGEIPELDDMIEMAELAEESEGFTEY